MGRKCKKVRKIRRDNPEICLSTDSSRNRWGSVLNGIKIGGRWKLHERSYHINALETLAIFFELQAFESHLVGKYVKILTDSTTAVSYVNNCGGIQSRDCDLISMRIWQWCLAHDIWIICSHVSGTCNIADAPSREFKDHTEWELNQDVFNKICDRWGVPSIYLFASRLNRKVKKFCSWKPDPDTAIIDAFSVDWGEFNLNYIFCPFSLVGRAAFRKYERTECQAIIIIPLWVMQIWWPVVMSCLVERPLILPPVGDILKLQHTGQKHPLSHQLLLIACKVSCIYSETEAFRKNQPRSLWQVGEHQQNGNIKFISKNGFHTVVKERLIQFVFL